MSALFNFHTSQSLYNQINYIGCLRSSHRFLHHQIEKAKY